MRTLFSLCLAIFLSTSALAEDQTVTVGPWTIATTYKADKFENCTMSRSAEELGISFVWTKDGKLLLLNSPKWNLDRRKTYTIHLVAGSRSVEAMAVAEALSYAISSQNLSHHLRLTI